jgi:hypothetical protein
MAAIVDCSTHTEMHADFQTSRIAAMKKNVKYTVELTEHLVNVLRTVADFSTPNQSKTKEQMLKEAQFITGQLTAIKKVLKAQKQ